MRAKARIKSWLRAIRPLALWARTWWITLCSDPFRWPQVPSELAWYLFSLREYKRLTRDANRNEQLELYPALFQRVANAPFDPHYVYQATWALSRIINLQPKLHVDVSSNIPFVTQLSVIVPVLYVELNPPQLELPRMVLLRANVMSMPFADRSLSSLSCLHVLEHVGLGRYGDPLDVYGPEKACWELCRCLDSEGSLFISVPIGKRRVQFNAHRIFDPMDIPRYIPELDLVEFSVVTDSGELIENTAPELYANLRYGCGLYWFRKSTDRVVKLGTRGTKG